MHPTCRTRLGTRRMVAISMVLTLLVSACISPDDTAGITTTTSVATQYSIVEDASYLGVAFGDETVEPYNAYPELGGWFSAMGPVGNDHGSLILYRRGGGSEREDLVVMFIYPDNVGVDALRLTGDTGQVHLGLSCSGKAVVLVSDVVELNRYKDLDEAVRAWRPGPDGILEEFDPATGEPVGSC